MYDDDETPEDNGNDDDDTLNLSEVDLPRFLQIVEMFKKFNLPWNQIWDLTRLHDKTLRALDYKDDPLANFIAERKFGGTYTGSWGQRLSEITPPEFYQKLPETRIREFIPNWGTTGDPIALNQEIIYKRLKRFPFRWI
jgi:hypothetical protein